MQRMRATNPAMLGLLAFWLGACAVSECQASSEASADANAGPPNIVLILADDHGWPDFGFMGHEFAHTPNLDELARRGTVFTNAHNTASLCRPSLLAFLTGVRLERWEQKHRALEDALGPIPFRQEIAHYRTLPRELATAGYRSWQGGKFWDGSFEQAGFTAGLAKTPPIRRRLANDGAFFGRDGWKEGTALAPFSEFLDEVGNAPFLAYLTPQLPHTPYTTDAEQLERYGHLERGPFVEGYYANVTWLDALVGKILEELERRKLRERTLVIFASDNGWMPGDDWLVLAQRGRGKSTLYELGFRTPLIFHWPGRVPEGATRNDLVSTIDVFATVLDYAGVARPRDRFGLTLRPAIERGTPVGRDKLVGHQLGRFPYSTGHFVRTDRWRYLAFGSGREELYEIAVDPNEANDVSTQHAKLLEGFRADVAAWRARLDANPLDCAECAASPSRTGEAGP